MGHLFCYGALKRGFCLNKYLKGQKFVGEATTVTGYALYDLGWFPGMKKHGIYCCDECGYAERKRKEMYCGKCGKKGKMIWVPQGEVQGELWAIDDFNKLDKVEGNYFHRSDIILQSPYEKLVVETYLYIGQLAGVPPTYKWEKNE